MPRSRALEETLAALNTLRQNPHGPDTTAELRRVLAGKSSHAAAKAAQIAGEHELAALTPDLVAAFDRFMINPVKADPTCAAKTAIVDALYRIGEPADDVFLRGAHHVQLEPVWGGKADTAGALRSVSALGLVRMHHSDAMAVLADLLADPEDRVRAEAARAIAYSDDMRGVPLLRLKTRIGDENPEVISECLTALLKLAPDSSLPFVAELLDRSDPIAQETAALALGASRRAEAFELLSQWWDRTADANLRRTALLAIAMLKRDEPIEFLMSLVSAANGPTARDAIRALAMYRHDDALVARVRDAAAQRTDVDLSRAIIEEFQSHD